MQNFLKIHCLLTKSYTHKFKKRYHHKRKESQRSDPKNCLPETAPNKKSTEDIRLYKSFNFSEGFIGVAKVAFSLERKMNGYFLGSIFLKNFFPVSVFLSPRRKYARKKSHRNSVKNARKIIGNLDINQKFWEDDVFVAFGKIS